MGVRYDYANQDASKQKLVSCKRHKDCSKRRHKGAINVVQRVTNSGVIVAKGWMRSRLQQQVQHLDKSAQQLAQAPYASQLHQLATMVVLVSTQMAVI